MNFVIHISGQRRIGKVNLYAEDTRRLPVLHVRDEELHHVESRVDADGNTFVAVVYKVPKREEP